MPVKGPFGFVGGLNTKDSAWSLPANSLTASQNCNIVNSDLVKRNGCNTINGSQLNSGAAVIGLTDWFLGGVRYLLTICGNKAYKSATLSSTFTDITGSTTITAGVNNQHTFASLNYILGIFGGTTPDTPLQWTGSGNLTSLAGSPPVGNIGTTANNFMFISGNATNLSRIYWSNVSDPGTWTSANFLDFRAGDGDIVTALIAIGQNLAIFKRRSIGLLYTQTATVSGASTLAPLTQVINGIGCPGPQALDALPDGTVVFLGSDAHVYLLQGGSSVVDISNQPPGYSNIQNNLNAMNFGRLAFAVVRYYPTRNQVWVNMTSSGNSTNDTVFVYNTILNVWESIFTNLNINVMTAMIDPRTTPDNAYIMITGDIGGFVHEQDKGTSDSTVTAGIIDAYGTISALVGADATDYTPASVLLPLEAQTIGQLTFGYGYNGLTDISTTTTVSESQQGFNLDVNFTLDYCTLAGPSTLRQLISLPTTGRVFSVQMQFRDTSATNSFIVHPVYLNDELFV